MWQKNKQTFTPGPVGAVSNRTGAAYLIDSKVYHKSMLHRESEPYNYSQQL